MKGLLIASSDVEYHGVCRASLLADYLEDKRLKTEAASFLEHYVEEETQSAAPTAYAVYYAQSLANSIGAAGEPAEVILYDSDEAPETFGGTFIGYDVCADDGYTSPLGLGYLNIYENAELFDDQPFFEEISPAVRLEYFEQLNAYGLFDEPIPAQEIAEYCNYLCDSYEDMFQGAENFIIVKIYLL